MIFPSSSGTLRDPDNFAGQWRAARHGTRGARCELAQLPQDCGNAHRRRGSFGRIGADHLGHAKVSMTRTAT